MTAEMTVEVDARAMAEFLEDSDTLERQQKDKNESPPGFAGFAKFMENYSREPKKEILQAKAFQGLNDIPPLYKSPEKKSTAGGLNGISLAITENPVLALLAGAVLVGGAIMLYKKFSGADEKKKEYVSDGLKRRRKKGLSISSVKADKIAEESLPEAESEISEIPGKPEKEEIISGRTLGVAIAATVAGSLAGAALGDYSLIAAIPLGILAVKKLNTNLSMMAAGMALANGYKSENSKGNFFEKALDRVKQFFVNLFDKFFFFKKEDQKTPEGYYRTMLGLMPVRT